MMTGEKPVEQSRARAAYMKEASRGRRKACNNRHKSIGFRNVNVCGLMAGMPEWAHLNLVRVWPFFITFI